MRRGWSWPIAAHRALTVTWSPDLGSERVYRVLGARGLGDAAGETHRGTVWEVVTEETKGDYNFFKVAVEMP